MEPEVQGARSFPQKYPQLWKKAKSSPAPATHHRRRFTMKPAETDFIWRALERWSEVIIINSGRESSTGKNGVQEKNSKTRPADGRAETRSQSGFHRILAPQGRWNEGSNEGRENDKKLWSYDRKLFTKYSVDRIDKCHKFFPCLVSVSFRPPGAMPAGEKEGRAAAGGPGSGVTKMRQRGLLLPEMGFET